MHVMHIPFLNDVELPYAFEHSISTRAHRLVFDCFPEQQAIKDAVAVGAAMVLTCRTFYRAFIPLLYDCIPITSSNAWLVSRALEYSSASTLLWLRPRYRALGGRVRQLVLSLHAVRDLQEEFAVARDLDIIAQHVPNLRNLVIDSDGVCFAGFRDVLFHILPASRLKKLAFRGLALPMFVGPHLNRFLPNARALRTLICSCDQSRLQVTDNPPVCVRLPELPNLTFLSCDETIVPADDMYQAAPTLATAHIAFSSNTFDVDLAPLWRTQGPHVMRLLITMPPERTQPSILFASISVLFPRLVYLFISSSLTFCAEALILRAIPATVNILAFGAAGMRKPPVEAIQGFMGAMAVVEHPTLKRILILDKCLIGWLVDHAAMGDDIGLSQLEACSVRVEDWNGTLLRDAITAEIARAAQ
jgi:hypothetical protein